MDVVPAFVGFDGAERVVQVAPVASTACFRVSRIQFLIFAYSFLVVPGSASFKEHWRWPLRRLVNRYRKPPDLMALSCTSP